MYALVPGDLRDFASSIAPRLLELLDPALPTLVLAECVFIYLDPAHSESILSWCTSTLGSAGAGVMTVQYDPVGLDDSFGRVMIRNLQVGTNRTLTRRTALNRTYSGMADAGTQAARPPS